MTNSPAHTVPSSPASIWQVANPPSPPDPSDRIVNLPSEQMTWDLYEPDKGDASNAITIVHVDRQSGATKLLIRFTRGGHVAPHWHTGNETHAVIKGTFIVEEPDGTRVALGPGSFNYIPARQVHQGWAGEEEDALLFITVDKPWDLNFVGETEGASE